MSEIVKTEAVVLSKLKYGDTSYITSLYTKEFGKISAIIKGARGPKAKIGLMIDPLNYIHTVIYKKDSRDLQIISSVDLLSNFTGLKDDLEKLKYSQAILELVKKLTAEHEVNKKLFLAIIRIFELLSLPEEPPNILFGRFLLFFISELGYKIDLEKCKSCGKSIIDEPNLAYNFEIGILCHSCNKEKQENSIFSSELFNYLTCLKSSKKIKISSQLADKANTFLENYLKHHIADFNGIQSLQIFK